MSAPGYLAEFDSASAMLRALAAFLHGDDFPRLRAHRMNAPLLHLVSALPRRAGEAVYRTGGWFEAVPPSRLGDVDQHEISAWLAGVYPRRRYPAVAVGSSNGAAVHLCAALGVPWLPQTLLLQVRRSIDVDDAVADLRWGARQAPPLLARNPDLELHHMGDPNQDRLMLPRTAYLRVKRRRLGAPERRFVHDVLAPGGTLLVVECRRRWPLVPVADRHWYQLGGSGGLAPEEYLDGSPRVEAFLRRQGSERARWEVGADTTPGPEAEWGFAPPLLDDLAALAADGGYRIRRVVFDTPEDLSPAVADLHRSWYRDVGYPTGRLFAPNFFLLEPMWTLRTASVPFWTSFAVEPAAEALAGYLERSEPFREAYATLFQHGIESIGVAGPARWREVLGRATERSALLGVTPSRFPRDFSVFVRYHRALTRLPGQHPLPAPLPLDEALDALAAAPGVSVVSGAAARP